MNDNLIHIAYAEDHPITLQGTIQMLLPLGKIAFDITARNGKELIEKLERSDRLPDICMLDIQMPLMDGFETLREIKNRWPEIRNLVLTGHNSEDYILRMIQCGANGYLLKHCEVEDIHNALLDIYRDGYYYSDVADSKLFHQVSIRSITRPKLTELETEVLKLCCYDLTYSKIADILNAPKYSVIGCRNRLFAKLNVNNRIGLVLYALRLGLVQLPLRNDPRIQLP